MFFFSAKDDFNFDPKSHHPTILHTGTPTSRMIYSSVLVVSFRKRLSELLTWMSFDLFGFNHEKRLWFLNPLFLKETQILVYQIQQCLATLDQLRFCRLSRRFWIELHQISPGLKHSCNSFSTRVVSYWNCLPLFIKESHLINKSKFQIVIKPDALIKPFSKTKMFLFSNFSLHLLLLLADFI